MTVFVVIGSDYDGEWIEGIYTNRLEAERHRDWRYNTKITMYNAEGWRIEEYLVKDQFDSTVKWDR